MQLKEQQGLGGKRGSLSSDFTHGRAILGIILTLYNIKQQKNSLGWRTKHNLLMTGCNFYPLVPGHLPLRTNSADGIIESFVLLGQCDDFMF